MSMNGKIQNFIFDWSGVISDDFHHVYRTYLRIFEHYNKPSMTVEEFKKRFRLPYMEFCREYLKIDREKEMGDIFKKYYVEENCIPETISGSEKALQELVNRNKTLIVLSSHSFVSLEARRFFPGKEYFSKIYEDIPDKEEAIGSVMSEMRFDPEQTVYIGDMIHDVKAGKKAKIKTAVVLTGYQPREMLEKEDPDYVLKDLAEIFKIVPL